MISGSDNDLLKKSVAVFCRKQKENLLRITDISNQKIEFTVKEFSTDKLLNFKDYKLKKVLYYFEIVGEKGIENTICEKIQKHKDLHGKELKLPQVNKQNAKNGSRILYVGKSLGYFSTRLKQHFGEEHRKTYALHLKRWNEIIGKGVKLKLHYTSFNSMPDEENELLELIETALHDNLKPILGRSGH